MIYLDSYPQDVLDELVYGEKDREGAVIVSAGRAAQIQYLREANGETTTREEDLQYVIWRLYDALADQVWANDLLDDFDLDSGGDVFRRAWNDHLEMMNR